MRTKNEVINKQKSPFFIQQFYKTFLKSSKKEFETSRHACAIETMRRELFLSAIVVPISSNLVLLSFFINRSYFIL